MLKIIVGKAWSCTHYCGRPNSYKNVGANLSILGNPYFMKTESDRDDVCDKYETYFHNRLQTDPEFKSKVLSILSSETDVVLGCYCAPKRCHCDTIKAYLEQESSKRSLNE